MALRLDFARAADPASCSDRPAAEASYGWRVGNATRPVARPAIVSGMLIMSAIITPTIFAIRKAIIAVMTAWVGLILAASRTPITLAMIISTKKITPMQGIK